VRLILKSQKIKANVLVYVNHVNQKPSLSKRSDCAVRVVLERPLQLTENGNMNKEPVTKGTLNEGEPHPAARSALAYIFSLGTSQLMLWMESFASNAIEGNRTAEICSETLARVLEGKTVSDRYVLGLAWILKDMVEQTKNL
jgi:hypothetical protein